MPALQAEASALAPGPPLVALPDASSVALTVIVPCDARMSGLLPVTLVLPVTVIVALAGMTHPPSWSTQRPSVSVSTVPEIVTAIGGIVAKHTDTRVPMQGTPSGWTASPVASTTASPRLSLGVAELGLKLQPAINATARIRRTATT